MPIVPLGTEQEPDLRDPAAAASSAVATFDSSSPADGQISVAVHQADHKSLNPTDWNALARRYGWSGMYCSSALVQAIGDGLRHRQIFIEARVNGECVGLLPLIFVRTRLFGRFLVSLPYVNWAGVIASRPEAARALIDSAVDLADQLNVRYLELRNTDEIQHPALTRALNQKVQMRLPLGKPAEEVWQGLKSEVRTQIRKARKKGLEVSWGGSELLGEFYDVFARNMRDLGTPVFPRKLFENILNAAPGDAELGIVRLQGAPIASCLAVRCNGMTEIPSASALRAYRSTAANSLMYWEAVERACSLDQKIFDFGRSTVDSSTFKFKKKWGAAPEPTAWQYYMREGSHDDMRPDNARFKLAIEVWKRLPLPVTRLIGPAIVRGIP